MVVRKAAPAKAAAKKAAPAKATAKPKAVAVKEEAPPNLLAGLDEPDAPDEDELSLLDGISEDSGVSWQPQNDDEQVQGIQGTILYVSSISSDYGEEDLPYLEVQDVNDAEVIWSIRGYATVLRNQIKKTNPQVGDFWACKYLGQVPSKKAGGKPYYNFKAAVQHK